MDELEKAHAGYVKLDAVQRIIERHLGDGITLSFHDDAWHQQAIDIALFLVDDDTLGFTRTLGRSVYFPDAMAGKPGHRARILPHEGRHILDRARAPGLFELLYLGTQALAPLAVLGVGWWPFLLFLLGLVLPQPARLEAECRGYATDLAQDLAAGRNLERCADHYAEWIADHYWTMIPRSLIRRRMRAHAERIIQLRWLDDYERDIYQHACAS